MDIVKLKHELYFIATQTLSNDSLIDADLKWGRINSWFSKHALNFNIISGISLDVVNRAKHDDKYLEYQKSMIVHKIAEALFENKSVTETRLVPTEQDSWGLYEQRTESKLWVLK